MNIRFRDYLLYIEYYPRFLYALWRLSRIARPVISVFGGTNVASTHQYYKMAFNLVEKLAAHKMSIITGGGPGIMDAALCAAQKFDAGKNCLGIAVIGVDEYFSSKCFAPTVFLSHFALRKWLLIYYSSAFVIFPGGIGTLDELTEVLNLMKTGKLPDLPIILINKEYWKPFVDWSKNALSMGFLLSDYGKLFIITDSIDEAFEAIVQNVKPDF